MLQTILTTLASCRGASVTHVIPLLISFHFRCGGVPFFFNKLTGNSVCGVKTQMQATCRTLRIYASVCTGIHRLSVLCDHWQMSAML